VPLTESIADCVSRVRPFWENELLPALLDGSRCLVVGHAGSRSPEITPKITRE